MAFKHKDIGQEITKNEWEAVDAHEGVLSVSHIPITSLWLKGLFASRPAASIEGRHYWATDTDEIWRDTGSDWEQVMESVALRAGDYPTAYVGVSSSATGRAAKLDEIIAARMEELDAANLPADIDTLKTRLSATRAVYIDLLNTYLDAKVSEAKADLTTLEARLSAARATNLDQLDFALQEAIAALPQTMVGTNLAQLASTALTQYNAIVAYVDEVETMLKSGTYGLSALEVYVDEVESLLKNGTYGLSAIKTAVNARQPTSTALTQYNAIIAAIGGIPEGASVLDIWRGLDTEYTPTFGSYSGTSTALRTILDISGKGIFVSVGATSSVSLWHTLKVTIDGSLVVDRSYMFGTNDMAATALFMWGFDTSLLVQLQHSAGYTCTYWGIALVE